MLFIKWFLYMDGQVDLNFKLIMLIHSLEKNKSSNLLKILTSSSKKVLSKEYHLLS